MQWYDMYLCWFLSLNSVSAKSIHVVLHSCSVFFFTVVQHLTTLKYDLSFVHFMFDEHLGCSQFGAVTNSAATDFLIHVF